MWRKNQHEDLLYFSYQYDVFLVEVAVFYEHNVELDPINEEFDEIYELVMPNFPMNLGKLK